MLLALAAKQVCLAGRVDIYINTNRSEEKVSSPLLYYSVLSVVIDGRLDRYSLSVGPIQSKINMRNLWQFSCTRGAHIYQFDTRSCLGTTRNEVNLNSR